MKYIFFYWNKAARILLGGTNVLRECKTNLLSTKITSPLCHLNETLFSSKTWFVLITSSGLSGVLSPYKTVFSEFLASFQPK